ncbi:MAG: PEP-utilizing enzyme [Candidatus Paceibacteria bacterium]
MNSKEFYNRQISLSEWFEKIDFENKEEFRKEDNEKRERLQILQDELGLPFDKPTKFKATDLRDSTEKLKNYLKEHKDELCALRLIPLESDLSKIRMRGLSTKEAMKWFEEQDIEEEKYRAEFIPHSDNPIWSTIFIVNENGVFGELIQGGHSQLTQGFYKNRDQKPISFFYDFEELEMERHSKAGLKHLQKIIDYLYVEDEDTKSKLRNKVNAEFVDDYLNGYFETISNEEYGLWFIDYNRVLGEIYEDYFFSQEELQQKSGGENNIYGKTGHPGEEQGTVKKVPPDKIEEVKVGEDDILVCEMTTPEYVPLMKQAKAIVTDSGGLLCHATIVARELDKPCIVGTNEATEKLEEGEKIKLNADRGLITYC